MSGVIKESTGTVTKTGGRRFNARLIEGDIWGSSGYYSKEVLERDGPTTWPAGTQIYLDHPGATENYDRPERSVKDLAGKITSTPAYESDGLYADVEFYPHYAPIIEAMWEDVGMSIRASATVENGEAAGRRGPVIQSLEGGLSVDVVTRAGAGGKLVSLLESARESAPNISLPNTVGSTKEKEDAIMATTIEESRLARLEEASGRVPVLEADNAKLTTELAEANKRADAAEAKVAESDAKATKATAEAIVAEAFGDTEAKVTRAALITAALAAEAFDADKLKADATEAAAEIAVTHGAGTPRGLGDTITESKTITDDDIVNAL